MIPAIQCYLNENADNWLAEYYEQVAGIAQGNGRLAET